MSAIMVLGAGPAICFDLVALGTIRGPGCRLCRRCRGWPAACAETGAAAMTPSQACSAVIPVAGAPAFCCSHADPASPRRTTRAMAPMMARSRLEREDALPVVLHADQDPDSA